MLTARFARPDEASAIYDFYINAPPEDRANLIIGVKFKTYLDKRCEEKREIIFSDPENGTDIYAVCHFGSKTTDEGQFLVGAAGALKGFAAKEDIREEYRPLLPLMISLRMAEMVARDWIKVNAEGEVTPIVSIGTMANNTRVQNQLGHLGFEPYYTGYMDPDNKEGKYIDYKITPAGLYAALKVFIECMHGENRIIKLADDFECLKPGGREKILNIMQKLNPLQIAADNAALSLWKSKLAA